MRLKHIIIVIIFIHFSCNLPTHPEPDLLEYPTYFDGLESDILYYQENDLRLIDKNSQTSSSINIPNFEYKPSYLRWEPNGNSISFIIKNVLENGPLYSYNIENNTIKRISDFECWNYSVSPDNEKYMLFTEDQGSILQLYEPIKENSTNVNEFIITEIESDSIDINYINTSTFRWITSSSFLVQLKLWQIFPKGTAKHVFKNITINYINSKLSLSKVEDSSINMVTKNNDGTFGFYKDQSSAFVINYTINDTVQISNNYVAKFQFSPNQRYILFSKHIVEVEFVDSYTKYFIYDTETNSTYDIFPVAYSLSNASFSSSGNQIVCAADFWHDSYSDNIWVMNYDGSNPTLLSDYNYRNTNPLFRP